MFLTNYLSSFQGIQVTETGLSDLHETNLTILQTNFFKHETVFYRNYKNLDNIKFKEALNEELRKHEVNHINHEIFHGLLLLILNVHAPLKTKHLGANNATSLTKEFEKAVIKRARLRNSYLKIQTEATKAFYNYQRNICVR